MILPDNRIPPQVWNGERTAFNWQGLEFLPLENYSYRATKESLRANGIGNMSIVIRHGMAGTLFISNSLHKVYHDGMNHTDFTFSELKKTVNFIGYELDVDFKKANLQGRIEFGVNIRSNESNRLFGLNQIFKSRRPVPMYSREKVYGAKFSLSSYEVKIYSPYLKNSIQSKSIEDIDPNLVRFEIAATCWYLRKKNINASKVSDLLSQTNLRKLGVILVSTANELKLIPLPIDNVEIQELEIWYFFSNATPEQLKHCRKSQKQTFYRHKKKFEKMIKEVESNGNEFGEKVFQKWEELLNS